MSAADELSAALALSLAESTSPRDRAIAQILDAGAAQARTALDLIGNTLLKNVLGQPLNPKFRSIKTPDMHARTPAKVHISR